MIKEVTATGKDIDEALSNAKTLLGAPETAEVHTEILEMPKKKVLGIFGGSPAKARAWWDAPEEKPKKVERPKKAAPKKVDKPAEKPKKAEPVKKAEPAKKAEAEVKAETQASAAEEQEPVLTKVELSQSPVISAAAAYLKTVVLGMGLEKAEIEAFVTEDKEVILELDCGENYGIVIGRRGETLDAIQYLTRLTVNKLKAESEYSRISINVGSYREKRKQTLCELAKKNSARVLKYGRNFVFEPMNPYERRIIHTTVQQIEGVTSHSVGSDGERRVVITLMEGVKPTNPSRGGYNNRGRGGRRPNGGRKPSNKPYSSDAPKREPKTDAGAQGFSLYGKIN